MTTKEPVSPGKVQVIREMFIVFMSPGTLYSVVTSALSLDRKGSETCITKAASHTERNFFKGAAYMRYPGKLHLCTNKI